MSRDKVKAFRDRYWDELSYFPWVVMLSLFLSTAIVKAWGQ